MEVQLKRVMARELKSRSMTISSLSKLTKIPRTTLHDWYNGRLPSSRNIHYLHTLSEFFSISLSRLLFDIKGIEGGSSIVHSSNFIDGTESYRLTIEKVKITKEKK